MIIIMGNLAAGRQAGGGDVARALHHGPQAEEETACLVWAF